MAGFMDSVNKGLATINVKTSNFMEESKFKTAIVTKETEINDLYKAIGEKVYANREAFSFDIVADMVAELEQKYAAIDQLRSEIEALSVKEKEILGSQQTQSQAPVDNAPKCYCGNCGAPNSVDNKFCEKCGSQLDK